MTGKKQNKQDEAEIKLPLPLEYCTVERAARLLGCEVEDIHHWHKVGAIRFYAHLKKFVKGEISINMRNICNFESVKPSDYIREVTKRLVAERSGGLTLPNFVENQDEMSHLEKAVLAIMHWDPDRDVNGTDGLSIISLGAFSDYAISTWALDELREGYGYIKSNCMASGFWEIFPSTNNDDSDVMHLELEHGINTNWGHTIKKVQLEIDKAVWDGLYYLLSEDLLRLYKAIQTGKPLPNRYNDPEIAEKKREQESGNQFAFDNFKTSHDTRGIALGVMAILLAETKKTKLMRGSRVNTSELMTLINQECGRLGIPDISVEVKKDISKCISTVTGFVEEEK